MGEKPVVSIIIQSFERPLFLEGCVKSLNENLIDKLGVPSEVIIADDGSGQEVKDLIARLPHDKEFFNTKKNEGKGPGYTLNEANKMAEGKYTLHLEDDFWMVHEMTTGDLMSCAHALDQIEGMELIRLRRLLWDNAETYRLTEYMNWSEEKTYRIDCNLFRMYQEHDFKKRPDTGPSYQYVGNPHLRKGDMWERLGPYPEDVSIWGLENKYAGMFRDAHFRSGRMMKGWFTHSGGKVSTKEIEGSFGDWPRDTVGNDARPFKKDK